MSSHAINRVWVSLLLIQTQAVAAPFSQPPSIPSTPPSLVRIPPKKKVFSCQRQYVYQGKLLECDSNLNLDGENLRPILTEVPEALSELNLYQKNRRSTHKLAYISTVGLAMVGLGFWLSNQYEGNKGIVIRNLLVIPGIAIGGGSLVYGFVLLNTNEHHLHKAVELYNDARPHKRIDLQFNLGISF